MKYALLLVFQYNKIKNKKVSFLHGAYHDLRMALIICSRFMIDHITVVTDIPNLNLREDITLKFFPCPDDHLVCREISQFIENTIRGIEDSVTKSASTTSEIFFYISAHGGDVSTSENEQGIVLTSNNGLNKKYLASRDLFNLIFGNTPISPEGIINIPVYEKYINHNKIQVVKNSVQCQLSKVEISSPVSSPKMSCSPHIKRKTYFSNRGIPAFAKMLIFIDTCHSQNMTYFPYLYDKIKNDMILCHSNIDIFEDLPYCVTIAACSEKETTPSYENGSLATKTLFNTIHNLNLKSMCTIAQLHNYINKNVIHELHISSTSNNCDDYVPFFSGTKEEQIYVIDKN